MKNTNFPLKKTFEKTFTINIGSKSKSFSVSYSQATIQEYHEFFAKTHKEQLLELYHDIKKQIPLNLLERILSFIFKGYRGHLERNIDIDKEIFEMMGNKFRVYNSIFSDVKKKSDKKETQSIYSANLSIVCQKYCISPTELFEKFTLEQYMWLQDGIVFIANQMDNDGKMENQMALVDKEEIKKRAAETRKAFESKS